MVRIQRLNAIEILDSRGRPTVSVTCELSGGAVATAKVPSGASTGAAEALELRDGDRDRYGGMGCRTAVANVNGAIADTLRDQDAEDQRTIDQRLLALDGTANKSHLGANAILGTSIAVTRAVSVAQGIPLYRRFAELIDRSPTTLPRLTINLFSGGKHAGGQVPIQDVLVVPRSADSIAAGLETVSAVFSSAASMIERKYQARLLTADEGGLAPPFSDAEAMLNDAVEAIRQSELQPGTNVCLAMDVAASHFYSDNGYQIGGRSLSSGELISLISDWVDTYPIVSVEDALAEDDWQHWPSLKSSLHGRSLTVGDDLLCTNPERIRRAIDANCCDTLLLKVNQIGTLTEAIEALRLARSADWSVTVSARSGETEDDWLADLAVGWGADQIKVGSITQSERLAKYNRLLAIEAETGLPVVSWPEE